MSWKELLLGKPLRSEEEQQKQVGVAFGLPVLGLDALTSAAYGPEAALTILLPLGALAPAYIGPLPGAIVVVLLVFPRRTTLLRKFLLLKGAQQMLIITAPW